MYVSQTFLVCCMTNSFAFKTFGYDGMRTTMIGCDIHEEEVVKVKVQLPYFYSKDLDGLVASAKFVNLIPVVLGQQTIT